MAMLKDLRKFYKKNGILSTHFTCRWKKQCMGNSKTFTGPKSAFVSSGYEKGKLPRLLFLSLDSGSGRKDPSRRTPAAVRRQEEIETDVNSLPKNKHWYRTHELAWYILRRFNNNLSVEDTRKYFAHANSAKCSMNNPGRKEADKKLFENCRGYLLEELKILNPNIIVSQGNKAKKAMEKISDRTLKTIGKQAKIILLNNREVFWLHTYHPNCYGLFYEQRNKGLGWKKYSIKIYKWVNNI